MLKRKVDNLHLGAGLAVVNLVAPLTALVGPGEVSNGNEEEGVAGVGNTGEGVVPRLLLVELIMIYEFKNETYQAVNAAIIPKAPPALRRPV